jgi:DNA-binding MarR family transcriptional regulator
MSRGLAVTFSVDGTKSSARLGVDARWLGTILNPVHLQAGRRVRVSARSKLSHLPPEPPPAVAEALRSLLSGRDLQAYSAVFVVRTTAQRMDNAITEWMADTAASPARFRILMVLWAARRRGVPHKEVVATLAVTRATVSGLMKGLERDGLVTSVAATDDRRNLVARLTRRGEAIIQKARGINSARLRTAFAGLSSDELTTLTTLLQRVQQGFASSVNVAEVDGSRDR